MRLKMVRGRGREEGTDDARRGWSGGSRSTRFGLPLSGADVCACVERRRRLNDGMKWDVMGSM